MPNPSRGYPECMGMKRNLWCRWKPFMYNYFSVQTWRRVDAVYRSNSHHYGVATSPMIVRCPVQARQSYAKLRTALLCVGSRVEVDKVGQAASKKINAARTTTEWDERCSPKSTMSGRSVVDASFSRVSICCRMCAHTEREGLNILPTCRFSSTFRSIWAERWWHQSTKIVLFSQQHIQSILSDSSVFASRRRAPEHGPVAGRPHVRCLSTACYTSTSDREK